MHVIFASLHMCNHICWITHVLQTWSTKCASYVILKCIYANTCFFAVNILRVWAADARLTQAFAMASVTGINYSPGA